MLKRNILILIQIGIVLVPAYGQVRKEESDLKREVTLYNPYKPSLADAKKKSFLPEINDTARVNPAFRYNVTSKPFSPTYSISSIKAASLLSDPLPKLYKSYVRMGFGSNNTPLGELSITNHRSRKGAVGFYAKHYSSNGKVPLENDQRVFSGFMDNDASLFGRKFFRNSYVDVDLSALQRTRYAYGYDPDNPFVFIKRDIRLNYFDVDGKFRLASLNLDSADLAYDLSLSYDFFHNSSERKMNHIGFTSELSQEYQDFYLGGALKIDHYTLSEPLNLDPKYILSLNPFVRKSTSLWDFNLGLNISLAKNLEDKVKIYFHPDIEFGFSIVPEYARFFAELSGKLENNDPLRVISINPYLVPDGSLFRVPNTNHPIIFSAGLKGNNGLEGNYLVSASYSVVNDLLLFSNIVYPDTALSVERGNHFIARPDDAEILNFHGELTGNFSKRLSFSLSANYYNYTLSVNDYAWNKPNWDGTLGFIYNLRNKIIAGMEINAIGKRKLMVSQSPTGWMTLSPVVTERPEHVNFGFSAEYRYTKILSFWFKMNNISWNRYYEWEYYPSQMFNFMVGFSYSL